jgi:hypothetical protein
MPRPSRQRRRARSRARSCARAPQDGSYKHLFSHPEMVDGLLRDFVQEDWLALIDFSTLEKRGGSDVTDDLRDREDAGTAPCWPNGLTSGHRSGSRQFQISAASRAPWWMRRARPHCQVPDTERRALSTLQ